MSDSDQLDAERVETMLRTPKMKSDLQDLGRSLVRLEAFGR